MLKTRDNILPVPQQRFDNITVDVAKMDACNAEVFLDVRNDFDMVW